MLTRALPSHGRRRRVRPRETWRRTAEQDLKERDLKTWAEAAIAATNRVDWKQRPLACYDKSLCQPCYLGVKFGHKNV